MADIDPQVLVILDRLVAPDLRQQVAMRQHPSRIGGQRDEQPVFDLGQAQGGIAAHDATIDAVDGEVAKAQQRFLRQLATGMPAQQGARPGQQFGDAEGLGQVIVGPGVEGIDLAALLAACRQDQDRSRRPGAVVANEIDPVAIRQAQIEHDQIGPLFGRQHGRVADGRRLMRRETLALKGRRHRFADLDFVFDDQDAAGVVHVQASRVSKSGGWPIARLTLKQLPPPGRGR